MRKLLHLLLALGAAIAAKAQSITPPPNPNDPDLEEATAHITAANPQARVFNYDFSLGASIPDNNPSGVADHRLILDFGAITKIELTLQISGGANGDYYVYLEHDGQIAVLLNRVGKSDTLPDGYNEPGLNVTFSENGAMGDIHIYRTTLTGNETTALNAPLTGGIANGWMPDGRNISPLDVNTDTPRTATFATFADHQLAGGWTLFAADLNLGQQGVLVGWNLEVTVIPEPAPLALLALGAVLALAKRKKA